MRGALLLLLLAACGHPRTEPPRPPMTAAQWTKHCSDRLEIARLSLVKLDPAFATATVEVDPKPWNPIVHFEARTGDAGIWWSNVEHGHHPCQEVARGFTDWRDNQGDMPMKVARLMRRDGDVAWLEANAVSDASAIAFQREMQRALAACLDDARAVQLAQPPRFNCEGDGDEDLDDDARPE